MTVNRIIKALERDFPKEAAEAWDNVGLLVGDKNRKVERVQVSLDATEEIIDTAVADGIDLMIVHHPLIFNPIRSITSDDPLGRKLMKLIENNIALYVLHTNMDSVRGGLNDYVGEILGLEDGKIVVLNRTELYNEDGLLKSGIGRIYRLKEEMDAEEFLKHVKKKLNLENLKVAGKTDRKIKKVGVVNGSGASYWKKIKKLGGELFLTGDIRHHEALDASEENMIMADIGHFESEIFFAELIYKKLQKLPNIEISTYEEVPLFKNY